jgi:hypothetical protein
MPFFAFRTIRYLFKTIKRIGPSRPVTFAGRTSHRTGTRQLKMPSSNKIGREVASACQRSTCASAAVRCPPAGSGYSAAVVPGRGKDLSRARASEQYGYGLKSAQSERCPLAISYLAHLIDTAALPRASHSRHRNRASRSSTRVVGARFLRPEQAPRPGFR